jgi:selenocysteine-specific elongation factor
MFVIGTAGHVDHGKSKLVEALTGIDPDRLREEKERGLTIDLGFAWFTLPGGEEVSIVDVPGHERFIKNMLAGVGGIDLALLVIAADEGVMPQTREHLAIVDLLGITHGVVAVTKADLVEPDFLELAIADAEDVQKGTGLEGSAVVGCSAKTGQGLDDLKDALEKALGQTPARRDIGRPRLPIDRAFTIAGFGTVVTGTLVDGTLSTGDDVEIVPGELRSRVRGLQAHGQKVDTAHPGRRTAVNLGGVSVDQLRRGMLVIKPSAIKPSSAFDLRLRAVRYLSRPVRHNLEVTFHTGSAEVEGRLLLLDSDRIQPGEEGWAQIRLNQPVAAVKGDRFIVRDPNDTLGGGRIVDTHVRRHRRLDAQTIEALESLDRASPSEVVLLAVSRREPVELGEIIAGAVIDEDETRQAVEDLIDRGELVSLERSAADSTLVYTAEGFASLAASLRSVLADYHGQFPLRAGMPREELRVRLQMPPKAFEKAVSVWTEQREAKVVGAFLAAPSHEPSLDHAQLARAKAYVESLASNRFAPSAESTPEEDLLAYLDSRGEIVRVGDGVAFAADAYREMVDAITSRLKETGTITLAEVRDMFGTSRKYAQALLEHMDDQRITRRVGDERVLRATRGAG